jgi:hypothetical protein
MNQFSQAPDNPICVISINLKNSQRYSLLKIDQRCHDTGNKFIAGVFEIIKSIDRPFGEGVQSILFSRAFITRKNLDSEKERLDRKQGRLDSEQNRLESEQ